MKTIFRFLKSRWVWGSYLVLVLASLAFQAMLPTPPPRVSLTYVSLPTMTAEAVGASVGASADRQVQMALKDVGEGETVILLHGSPGDHEVFGYLMPLLAQRYRVIAPDLPGFGASSRWLPDYSNRAHARYVLTMMDELGIERATVLGFSMGAGVAYQMADLAPDRVRALVVYGGVGIVEGEGSGSHAFERLKYALGFAALTALPELVPHFGLLGRRADRYAFLRNFWDSDLRPMRGIITNVKCPYLILQGHQDPLVSAWVAEAHHDLVDKSELVLFDDDHFMLFTEEGTQTLYKALAPFLRAHLVDGQPPSRRTLDLGDPDHKAVKLPVDLDVDLQRSPLVQIAIIAGSTFVSEDLVCVTVGMLIREGKLDWFVGLVGCILGIFLGDLGLWALGRFAAVPLMHFKWTRRWFPDNSMDLIRDWFDRYGWSAVFISRFLPGTRFPTYVGAGMLGRKMGRFMIWSFIANAIWSPMLIMLSVLFGEVVARPFRAILGHGWLSLGATLIFVFLLVRLVVPLLTEEGRNREKAKVAKLWRWEFWPPYIFYLPILPWIVWQILRHRSLMCITAANPAIPGGGFVGESKMDILSALPTAWTIPSVLLPASTEPDARLIALEDAMQAQAWEYPVVLKPNASQRGAGVKVVRHREGAAAYLQSVSVDVLVQPHHPGPYEAGIFYYRIPGDAHGRIFSITDKEFAAVTGDGTSTVRRLILTHPRYRMQADLFLRRLHADLERVPAEGERVSLGRVGNHCQGTLFRDGAHLITPELEALIDEIALGYEDFYIGRFDVRYSDVEAFKLGKDLAILELNGVTSESTNIYDPTWSLFRAYGTLCRQWSLIFQIGAINARAGHPTVPLRELARDIWRFWRSEKPDIVSD